MTDIAEPVLSGRGPSPALTGGGEAEFKDYIALMKPRVMSLAIFTALVGLIVAPGALHPVEAFAALVCIAVGAGASGALNMWWDADIDARMSRTALRGVPAGRVEPGEALAIGLGLSVLSVALLFVFAGALAAGLLAFTIFFYAVIYTMWLKRSTPQNIVIGGAAGAFPPMIGWAVATGDVSIESVLMFAVIFLWTPPHFWALAIFRSKDYARAGVPMLPVARGDGETRRQILAYSVLLAISTFALAFTSIGGPIFFAAAVVANVAFLRWAWVVARRDAETSKADSHSAEKKLFSVSLFYLFGVFLALALETPLTWAVGDLGWPVWF